MELSVAIQTKVEVTPSNWNFGFQPTFRNSKYVPNPPCKPFISDTFTAAMQTVQITFVRKLQKEEVQPWMAVKALLIFCKI